MKKYFEATPNLDGLKEKIIVLKDGEDRKTLIAVIALVAAVLIAVTAGVVYLLKTRMDDAKEQLSMEDDLVRFVTQDMQTEDVVTEGNDDTDK